MSSSGLKVASAGAMAQSSALDATANNIANAATVGFHAQRISFKETLGQAKSADTAMVSTATAKGVDGESGPMLQTGNPLDLALSGDGMFSVQTPTGTRYTRAGNFQLSSENTLVTQDGYPVLGQGGATISIPPTATAIAVGTDGNVTADGAVVGKLQLERFDPSQLKREGGSLFSASGTPLAEAAPKVQSGVLESSNFNVVRGIVDLVKTSRSYESLMKVIQSFKEIDSKTASDMGGPK